MATLHGCTCFSYIRIALPHTTYAQHGIALLEGTKQQNSHQVCHEHIPGLLTHTPPPYTRQRHHRSVSIEAQRFQPPSAPAVRSVAGLHRKDLNGYAILHALPHIHLCVHVNGHWPPRVNTTVHQTTIRPQHNCSAQAQHAAMRPQQNDHRLYQRRQHDLCDPVIARDSQDGGKRAFAHL
jgi:hypothetical protein